MIDKLLGRKIKDSIEQLFTIPEKKYLPAKGVKISKLS